MKLRMKQIISFFLAAVLLLSGLFPAGTGTGNAAPQADWEPVDIRGFTLGEANLLGFQINQDIPYVAYMVRKFIWQMGSYTYKLMVLKYENGGWLEVGNTESLEAGGQS
ncbi:hypothetical protein GC093_11615 [Paenibacillus sp. LMG 31456]|uniref:Uncharacterized protein n=1 Tax=Paenibacillus foliorum TaxID=2654974 RepID=A0A972GP67_9BACL|nr:hypothetical protein [Paenibacillus foliorum]NOU93868.1 hypothetical protein [Paenibacillus foliorum]